MSFNDRGRGNRGRGNSKGRGGANFAGQNRNQSAYNAPLLEAHPFPSPHPANSFSVSPEGPPQNIPVLSNVSIIIQQQPSNLDFGLPVSHGRPTVPQNYSSHQIPKDAYFRNARSASSHEQPSSNIGFLNKQTSHNSNFGEAFHQPHQIKNFGRDQPLSYDQLENDKYNYSPAQSHQKSQFFSHKDNPHLYTSQDHIDHKDNFRHSSREHFDGQQNQQFDRPRNLNFNGPQNRQQNQHFDQQQNQHFDGSQNRLQNQQQNQIFYRQQNQQFDRPQNQHFVRQQNQHFDGPRNQHFDRQQNQQFDGPQNQHFDRQQNQHFDRQQNRQQFANQEFVSHNEEQSYSTQTRSNIFNTSSRRSPPPPYDQVPNLEGNSRERINYNRRQDPTISNDSLQQNRSLSIEQQADRDQSKYSKENKHDKGLPPPKNKTATSMPDNGSNKGNLKKNKDYRSNRRSNNASAMAGNQPGEMEVRAGRQADMENRITGPFLLERQSSNVSLAESVKSYVSESPDNHRHAINIKMRYKGKKLLKQTNTGQFTSLPNLNVDNLQASILDEAQDATERPVKSYPKRKSRHKTKKKIVQNNNPAVSVEDENAVSITRSTMATLQIGSSFIDAENMQEVLCQNMDTAERELFTFEIVKDSIVCDQDHSECTIIFKSIGKQLGKRQIKNLCHNLRKSLKTKVVYEISSQDVDRNAKSVDLTSREKQSSNRKEGQSRKRHPGKSPGEQNVQRQVNFMLDKVNFEENIETSKDIEQPNTLEKEQQAEKEIMIKKEAAKIPTKMFVKINKFFLTEEELTKVLAKILNKLISFKLVPGSFNSTNALTSCVLMAPSKAESKRIKDRLKYFHSEDDDIKIECNVFEKTEFRSQSESTVEEFQVEIQEAIESIKKKAERTLQAHQLKMKTYEDVLEMLDSSGDDDDNWETRSTVEYKKQEAQRQQDVFCYRRDELIERITNLKTLKTYRKGHLSDLLQSAGVECLRLEAALPIYARRADIIKKLSENQVSIILGETGSGKSTQMTQYIHEAEIAAQGLIVCTQPRKVAAITLAERVAKEMADKVGRIVGYKTGLKKKISPETKIIFATDHCLLNECLTDKNLSRYSCIIVDEAHERSIYTDLLLGMVKACLPRRPDLKVIITSATIDPEIFINYFSCGPELKISGRTFPVDIVYSDINGSVEFENFEINAVNKAIEVHEQEEPGDILVFLTSAVDIMLCIGEFEKRMLGKNDYKCFPLHGQLPHDEQRKVFEKLSGEIRKIIFATNCAETSITIDGIKYVIDTGVAKELQYDSKRNMCMLGSCVISKSAADQRKGRAGRTASGKCFCLYTEDGYNSMKDSTQPEIMKVPLAQSVLKLAELGIDVKNYDFVQAPSAQAIDSALETLKDLGAISYEGITVLGRWISKLPFSPKEGSLIYHGNNKNLLYDSVVVAALITNGSNLFYRGLTESEAQTSAQSKSKFGSPFGDIFTWLEVYKTWITIDAKKQSKWCKDNSINYNVMTFTRQCVHDVATILRNEFNIELKLTFAEDDTSLLSLRKMLFEAYRTSVCSYLGHARAGYLSLVGDRQVHIHPSSNVLLHNCQPEWVVYTEFTKTSRDFIKGITVIEEDWIQEAIKERKLAVDLDLSKKQKIEVVFRDDIGSSVFRKLVGLKYSQLRVWEDNLTSAGMKAVVVEADCELKTFEILSSSAMNEDLATSLTNVKSQVIESLKSDEAEIDIFKKSSMEASGVRVVIGQGGCVRSLLMPDQSNKIIITKPSDDATDDDIKAKFGVFGQIKECVRFKRTDPWGFIRYGSFIEAKTAMEQTCKDSQNVAVLKFDNQSKKMGSKFEARLSWCRRPIKGNGTAFIKCPPIEKATLNGRIIDLPLCGNRELSLSKKGDDLVCLNTGSCQESEIKNAVITALQYDKDMAQNIHVSVVRERVNEGHDQLNRIRDTLSTNFSRYVAKNKFKLNIVSAKYNAINQVAFIHFDSPTDGFRACTALQNQLCVFNQSVEISPKLKTSLHVPLDIINACRDRFDKIVEDLQKYKETQVNVRATKFGNYMFDIKSQKTESMVEARELLQKELQGEIIDCTLNNYLRKLLNHQGKETLHKIESRNEIFIVLNERKERVHIYGSEGNVSKALIEINSYVSKISEGIQVDISLRSEGKPPGLMKEVMRKYTNLHDDLMQAFSLSDVSIDFKHQKLSIFGSEENVNKALVSIKELESSLPAHSISQFKKGLPDCVVCFSPVESSSEMYRLEACGHCYCFDCLKMQIKVSEQGKMFPVVCTKSDCLMPIVWRDFQFCINKKWTTKEKLADKSVSSFVAKNPDKYKFCITPDCPVIYEVTETSEGAEFSCPSCMISLCTSCHTAYHAGLTCSMSRSCEDDRRILVGWLVEDPIRRKLCPHCQVGVEKVEGCNKMHCSSCHAYFCWLCLKCFPDEQLCYAHLQKVHGGFY